MHQILTLQLDNHNSLSILAPKATLENIVCCDCVMVCFYGKNKKICLQDSIPACELETMKQFLINATQIKQRDFKILDSIIFSVDLQGVITIKIFDHATEVLSQPILPSIIQAWISQLDLLSVLMEENEKGQQDQGRGCC